MTEGVDADSLKGSERSDETLAYILAIPPAQENCNHVKQMKSGLSVSRMLELGVSLQMKT